MLGLDWQTASLGEFMEAVEAHNEAGQPDKPEPASADFRAWMKRQFKDADGGTASAQRSAG